MFYYYFHLQTSIELSMLLQRTSQATKKATFLFLVYFIQFSLAQPDRPCSALVDMPLLYGIKHLVPIISHLEYSVQICLLVLFDPS